MSSRKQKLLHRRNKRAKPSARRRRAVQSPHRKPEPCSSSSFNVAQPLQRQTRRSDRRCTEAIHLLSSSSARVHPARKKKEKSKKPLKSELLLFTSSKWEWSREISQRGFFSPDKTDTSSLLKVITWTPPPPPNERTRAHRLTFNEAVFSERPPSEETLQSGRNRENCLYRTSGEWA